jgi:starch synthase (maltosyl-transferring)
MIESPFDFARISIERITPEIDHGAYPIKRTVGESVRVEADIFTDGHDALGSVLLFRRDGEPNWLEQPMRLIHNDRWQASFLVTAIGRYFYSLRAWIDRFGSWQRDLEKKIAGDQVDPLEFLIGAQLIDAAGERASRADAARLREAAAVLRAGDLDALTVARDGELNRLINRYPDPRYVTRYEKELAVIVDRERARFSAWYEMFPRSCAVAAGRHGTFKDCERRIPYIASMGFDVLYLPPIHPIGRTRRKGRNGALSADERDCGSPWAIGSQQGGHDSIHPELGSFEDFDSLVRAARAHGIEVALDLAFQCSPDHPYVTEHPEWFRWLPDRTIQCAENPPKKYQDIYPLEFSNERADRLWRELKAVTELWLGHGIRIFRVDNPHTKPFPFWHWLIGEIKREYPDVIFLAEAFTRPKVMYRLAKLGFTQSYSYFAWRNSKAEITEYFTELTHSEVHEYFRANLWPNTPDILTEYLQFGGRPAFVIRLILAATLGANYGIYGPAFELCESQARQSGSEEYDASEKYQIRLWNLDQADSLRELIARVNRIRRDNGALQSDHSLRFVSVDNDQILCYVKGSENPPNTIVTAVNLDPHHRQSGWIELPAELFDAANDGLFQLHDLLTDAHYLLHGRRVYVELDPHTAPAHIFCLRGRTRRERDFDYFL